MIRKRLNGGAAQQIQQFNRDAVRMKLSGCAAQLGNN
jgi:hypothetical protein